MTQEARTYHILQLETMTTRCRIKCTPEMLPYRPGNLITLPSVLGDGSECYVCYHDRIMFTLNKPLWLTKAERWLVSVFRIKE